MPHRDGPFLLPQEVTSHTPGIVQMEYPIRPGVVRTQYRAGPGPLQSSYTATAESAGVRCAR